MLSLSNVSSSYGVVPMLQDVSLDVREGEVVSLLGPNGAGKSTMFKVITGLLATDEGKVTLVGEDVQSRGTEKLASLGVGFVPEGRRLFPSLTVRENLKLGYDASGCKEPFEQRLREVAELFPRIRERLSQPSGTMSGGEQAMVALARALIGAPKFVVMDEPSLGLSPKLIAEYFEIVKRIREEGTTVLLIEQNAETALSVSDRGYLLVRGRIVVSGASSELMEDDTVRHLYL